MSAPIGVGLKRLVCCFRLWRQQRLYNRAITLLCQEESYWQLANMDLPKIGVMHAARRRREQKIQEANEETRRKIEQYMEAGITGMYD